MVALLPAKYAQAQCDAPTSVATGEVTTDGATISWDESATADSYTVSYRVHGDVDWTEAANSLTTTSYTFTGLVQGTSYDYRVQAVCGGGASAWTTSGESPFQVSFKPPLIKGAVFGGGRMADVDGKTFVEVKECQAIGSVFGGNDIAGEVKDADGATITLGTGSKTTPIIIGSVYGGGNGYYYYPSVGNVICNVAGTEASAIPAGYVYGYWSAGSGDVLATLAAATTAPSVQKTLISVKSDRVYIDSLFGGAKNAIISGDASPAASDTTASIRISGGTVFSVFGGNNYGGFLAGNTTQHIVVGNTKALSPNSSTNLGGIHSTGVTHTGATIDAWTLDADAHSICYVFGGGNKVRGQNVHIEVKGGQIDTCFGGGNSADVRTVLVDVNVTTPKYDLAHSPYTDATTYAYSPVTSVFDIRCLFGGNNAADMSCLPTLNLTKGGVHNVYGGGNRGVMMAESTEDYIDNYRRESITPTNTTNHGIGAKRSTNVFVNSAYIIIDTIYGGGQSAGTLHDTYVEIAAGNVGVVYGGTNIMGQIGPTQAGARRDLAKTNVYIHGGTVYNSVFGASNGLYRCHNGNIYLAGDNPFFADANAYSYLIDQNTPSVFNSYVYITTGANIYGNVYGGGNMAVVGKPAAIASPAVLDMGGISLLHIDGGTIGHAEGGDTIWGNVYGGGNMGSVYGAADVIVSGSPIIYGNVYGGNDKTGRVYSPLRGLALTEIHNSSSLAQASALRSEYPGLPADITQNQPLALNEQNAATYTLIKDTPKIYGSVFGGGNGDYEYVNTYSDKATAIDAGTSADRVVIDCSGTASADERSSFVDINVGENGYVNRVFGGGNSRTTGYALNNGTPEDGFSYVFLNSTAAPADNENNVNVGTIFGGNNNVVMNRVPRIVMLQGKVGNVYGGGNMGAMTGLTVVSSLPVSTYVATPSPSVVVTKNIYGGCNVADVENDTYVKVTQGKIRGNVFGGNDLSGTVGISHVVIDGKASGNLAISGNVYGGGNGDYPLYVQQRDANGAYYTKSDASTVHAYNDAAAANGASDGVAGKYCTGHFTYFDLDGRPYVDSASVVLNGEFTMTGNVYGGGISGDCRKTNVLVDAADGDFEGMIFGAGRGRVNNMGLRIGTCHDTYIGVAQDANNDGVTDRDGSDDVVYGTSNAMGNVLDTAFLTVRRFKSMRGAHSAMFGGGQAGNVRNTMVVYENTATAHLPALYLGCLASDVTNTATGIINANEDNVREALIDTIYGGNDFTGRVNRTDLTINSGVFDHVFGAGNGDYDYKTWITNRIGDAEHQGLLYENRTAVGTPGCTDTVPYTMEVNVTINGGTFLNTVYGGGNMGLVGNRDMVAANMSSATATRHNDIGRITVNIHGGDFHRHVFTGARGKTDMEGKRFFAYTQSDNNVNGQPLGKQLAYAQKILNMDGGHVAFSVYGGSEAVDDGFPYECYDSTVGTTTTLRPSSVVNIVGGRVEKSVYGGGYQGNIYGSVYVNIGIDAVRDCPAWDYTNGTFAMVDYKPNLTDHSGYTLSTVYQGGHITQTVVPKAYTTVAGRPTLRKGIIDLEASVYNASDWGEAGSNSYFNTRGVFGGVTNILIDGKGYYTSLTNPFDVDLPSMNISNSIIGAGTSTEGGDVNRLIVIRHFGDYACPDPSKTLYSIQRADKVVLDSVFINLLGDQDAFSAFASPNYSLCRIDTLIFRIDNVITIESPAIYIGNVSSMKTDETYAINDANQIYDNSIVEQEVVTPAEGANPAVYSTAPNDFFDNLSGHSSDCVNNNQCDNLDICLKLPNTRGAEGSELAANVLMMRNGSYVKISPFIDAGSDGIDDPNHAFGHVYGWMFLLAQDLTMSYVYADVKEASVNTTDGGFVAPCYCDNFSGTFEREIDYINVDIAESDADYRSWKVGTKQGTRVRNITLVANAIPDNRLNHSLPADDYDVYVGSNDSPEATDITIANNSGYAYATTTLELPPADGGSFYIINSVLIDQDNGGQLVLVDQGYDASRNNFSQTTNSISLDLSSIAGNPDYTFGLTFSSNANFNNASCWNTGAIGSVTANDVTRNLTTTGVDGGTPYPCWSRTNISGNNHITNQGGYISNAIITGAVGAIPTMSFTLTYNTNIHTTIMRDVVFTMYEFNAAGQYVGPVEVTVTISTVIKDFADLEAPVLAMYNEGISDEYVRKVTIPASFQQRDVYVEGIEWMKDDNTPDGTYTVYEDPQKKLWFNMVQYNGTAVENNKEFSVLIKPTESSSGNVNNTLGWYHIEQANGIDIYEEAKRDYEATTGLNFKANAYNGKSDSIYNSLHYDGGTDDNHKTDLAGSKGNGIWLGTLDGRSTANIDVTLKFNGMYYYHDQFNPPLAWIRLKCHYYSTKSDDEGYFYISVKLRTRFEGDTIYMAAGKTLTRTAVNPNGGTQQIKMHAYGYGYQEGTDPDDWEPVANATPNYSNITIQKGQIKGNPNNYLQDFRQAMLIFEEGDVIDIMEPIPITSGVDPISVMGDDYSTIQIIRYSGSHYKFPTMGCANYGPLIDISGSGFLTMRNVWFNGSGCTRTKEGVTSSIDPSIAGGNVTVGTYNYYENHRRVQTTLYANAPVIYCHGNGNVSFNRRVIITNNFNRNFDHDTTNTNAANNSFIGGGGIAVVKDLSTGAKPRVVLGDLSTLYDNLVVDWNAATRNSTGGVTGTADSLPKNYGGGVYVNGGELVLGSGTKDANLQIARNFYLKNLSDNAALKTKTAHVFTDASETEMEEKTFQVYYLDTLEHPRSFALSNIYLTRKAYMCDDTDDDIDNPSPVTRRDEQNDVVYFLSEMDPASKVGISKWFPGYIYTNSRNTGYNFLTETTPRDTIAIARIGKGKSNTAMVDNNYNANIFFNDSSYYSIDNRTGVVHPAATPSFGNISPAVAYSQNTTGYQNHRDRVFIYRHTSLSQYNIYFQRCASFGKGVRQTLETSSCFANSQNMQFNTYTKGDSISYHWNSDATCALAMDTIRFRVGGGFFPYTYQWNDVSDTVAGVVTRVPLHTRVTTGSNAIARFGTDEYEIMRNKAEYDTLVFRLHVNSSNDRYNYTYEVTATDLTGNCPVTQAVKVRVAKVATDHHDDGKFYYDLENFLLHRKHGALVGNDTTTASGTERFYSFNVPGVDSSSFHDHPNAVPTPTRATSDYGQLARAGYTHTADCSGTNDDYSGKPYAGDGNCTDGDMTPRYLRLFRSYRVKPNIYPVAARGTAAQEAAEPPTSGGIDIYSGDGNDSLFSLGRTNMSNDNWHSDKEFCPGEVLQLRPHPAEHTPEWEFIGWSFDPSANDTANFVVTDNVIANSPVIFYVPGDYWWQVVTSFDNRDVDGDEHTATLRDYKLDYYGNVEIKTKKGLAWLISTVNGYNGQNAQTFHFNTIRLDSTLYVDAEHTNAIDMSEHKWTPLGNVNNPFEGTFEGMGQHITNILVNEHTIPLVGMFGHTRGATIRNFTLDSTMVRGDTYVSAICGEATENTLIDNVTIQLGGIFGEYTIGGFISHMVNSTLSNCKLDVSDGSSTAGRISAYGNAIYAGGFVGYAEGSTIINNHMPAGYINISQLSAVYVGAQLGRGKDTEVGPLVKTARPTVLNNNYAQLITSNKAQRVGGLVGYAEGMDINNNYVYGKVDYDKSYGFAGGLLGFAGDNVNVSNSYYVDGLTNSIVGYNSGSSVLQKSTTFRGKGNKVMLTESVDGYNNLTRALNAWVRDHGDTVYNTWRSDLENANSGYPVFGEPDLIPVNDTLITSSCENFEFDGLTFDQSGIYIFHVVDSSDFVDSTLTVFLTINYGDTTQVADTVNFGEGYEGHGFSLSADELRSMSQNVRIRDVYALQFIDSLQNANGCDSLVVLTLYIVRSGVDVPEVQKLTEVKVYPNPTLGLVNVEGSDLESIEVYDNISRRVLSRKVEGDRTTFDLSQQAAGSYYVRVRTANGTVVKKVIKK